LELNELNDEELLKRFLSGTERAYEVLMRRHEDRVFALALRMTRNRSDAFEATQEAFIAAFRRAASFRGDSSFGTWLYRIAINACKDLLRRRARFPEPVPDPVVEETSESLESTVAGRVDLSHALLELPEEYRTAVVLHDLCDVSYEDIAAATGAPMGTVKSRISRGRRLLASALEQPVAKQTSKREP
jgi:RNA polymerase sigma-70 factor, ECF subfamily